MGEVNFMQEDGIDLETTRARFSSVLKRHEELTERLSRDSDKMIYDRLQREFEAARASQTQEVCLDLEQWNDGLLATIRERVHMEAERKATQSPVDASMLPISVFHDKITYKVGTKVICCLEGARIGIQYETSFAGEPREQFHCVLESKSFLEKMTVLEHTVPFFLPIREAENDLLSSNAMKFIDHIGDLLQAYVDRREQVILSVSLTAAGVVIAALGDFSFDLLGYIMAFISVFFQTMYLVLVERSGAEDGLSSIEIMFYNSLLSLPFLVFLIMVTGEFPSSLSLLYAKTASLYFFVMFVLSLVMGIILNYTMFLCTIVNSALTTTIVGVLKGVGSTTLGFFLLGGVQVHFLNVSGLVINTLGGLWYSLAKYQEKSRRTAIPR